MSTRSTKPGGAARHPRPRRWHRYRARLHVVAVPQELCDESVQTFQTFTGDIERMADWLVSIGIETVAMESTGLRPASRELPAGTRHRRTERVRVFLESPQTGTRLVTMRA